MFITNCRKKMCVNLCYQYLFVVISSFWIAAGHTWLSYEILLWCQSLLSIFICSHFIFLDCSWTPGFLTKSYYCGVNLCYQYLFVVISSFWIAVGHTWLSYEVLLWCQSLLSIFICSHFIFLDCSWTHLTFLRNPTVVSIFVINIYL